MPAVFILISFLWRFNFSYHSKIQNPFIYRLRFCRVFSDKWTPPTSSVSQESTEATYKSAVEMLAEKPFVLR